MWNLIEYSKRSIGMQYSMVIPETRLTPLKDAGYMAVMADIKMVSRNGNYPDIVKIRHKNKSVTPYYKRGFDRFGTIQYSASIHGIEHSLYVYRDGDKVSAKDIYKIKESNRKGTA